MKNHREKKIEKGKIKEIISEIDNILCCYSVNLFDRALVFLSYENAYLELSRQDQIRVLEISEKLNEMIKTEIKFKKNEKYAKNYLRYQDDEKTMFDKFETNHPHFEILPQEKIEEIHKRGKMTPEEKYNEWACHNVCAPGDFAGSAGWRCDKYGNCRDCLVAYAMEQEEWPSFELVCRNLYNENNGISKTIGDKKPNFLK